MKKKTAVIALFGSQKKERCKDEALLLAEWEKKYKGIEWMMKGNRGVQA